MSALVNRSSSEVHHPNRPGSLPAGAAYNSVHGQLRSAAFIAGTSRHNTAGFGQRIGLSDTKCRRNCRIVAVKRLSRRSVDLTIKSPAVGERVQVRLLLPAHFQTQPKRRWPVLYLLHGCCDTYVSWSRSTGIEQTTAKATSSS